MTNGYICTDSDYGTIYYQQANGDIFRAPKENAIDSRTGYIIGRWEAPKHMAASYFETLRKFINDSGKAEIDAFLATQGAQFQTALQLERTSP